MNAEHPARLLALPATMLLLFLHVSSARADRAENAFVAVRAVGADVERKGGRNFTANEDCEVEIAAHPGWVLLTPSRVRVTKNQSPRYRVRSVSNEDEGEGDVERIEVEQILHHEDDPTVLAQVSVGGPYVYAAPDEGMDVVLSGTAAATPGTHVIETRTTVYKNGAVVSTRSSISDPFPLELDQWSWEWSLGPENGTTNVQSFSTAPVFLTHGTYTARGKVSGSSSQCAACTKTDTASTNFPVSLLSVTCDPWIGQDRTGDPSSPYESPKVTATASLAPANPDVKKVTWGGENKCEKREPKDWTLTLWTEDRNKASNTYLGEKVTATAAGATATTNFTIVKVDVTIGGSGESSEENPGAYVGIGYREPEEIPQWEFGSLKSVSFSIFPKDIPGNSPVSTVCSEQGGVYKTIGWNGWESLNRAKLPVTVGEVNDCGDLSFHGIAPSESLQDGTLSISHEASGASDQSKFTTVSIESRTAREQPEPRTRTKIGVMEEVSLILHPAGVPSPRWSCTGTSSIQPLQGEQPTLYASDVLDRPIVSVDVSGAEASLLFEVLPPDSVTLEIIEEHFDEMVFVIDFKANIFIGPSDVNFEELWLGEEECDGVATDYYDNDLLTPENLRHIPGPKVTVTNSLVTGKGWPADVDFVSSQMSFPDFSDGSLHWDIPWYYVGRHENHHRFFVAHHRETLKVNANGSVTKTLSKCNVSITKTVFPEP